MTSRLALTTKAAIAAEATLAACLLVPVGPAIASPVVSAGAVVAAKSDGGALRVIAQGVPDGRSAKITVSGRSFRKKLPQAGMLRNLQPGRYKVWPAPVVANGGTAAVPNSPVSVRVPRSRSTTVRLTYQWNPKTDPYPPGPVSGLEVTETGATVASLRWVNSVAPDLQGVEVRRKQGAIAPLGLDDGKAIAVDASATTVTDTGLRQFTTYSYSVFMVDTAGNVSTAASVTTRTSGHAADVVAGTQHTCALLTEPVSENLSAAATGGGQVACWGNNDRGQLGSAAGERAYEPQPVDLTGVTQVTAGADHSCALLVDQSVWCWGRNDHGQLGNGTTTDSMTPVAVGLNSPTKTVIAGGDHTCAVSVSDGLRCWGDNQFGQSGQRPSGKVLQPPAMPIATSVGAVALGWSHTCFLRGGIVRCFGANDNGQLGDGTTQDSWTPVQVPALTKASALTAGVGHTCALLSDKNLYCWGANAQGQIGDGTTTEHHLPVAVAGAFTEVSAGSYHTCAIGDGNLARCWGRGQSGRLGDGTGNDRTLPTKIALTSPVLSIAAGGYHSCAVTATDTYCWGANSFGQVGVGTTTTALRPTLVTSL